jgi:HEAT repeat protein
VQLILGAIETSADPRRLELIANLGACQNSLAVKPLCNLLNDPSPLARAQAACSLAEIHDRAAIQELRHAYYDPNSSVRREAIVAGAELGDLHATEVGLRDRDEAVVEAACSHLTNPQSVSEVCDSLAALPTQVRVAALESLAITPPSGIRWRELTSHLTGSASERYAALHALAAMGVADSWTTIRPYLEDPNSLVRRGAVEVLGRTASPSEQQTDAMRMLADADPAVRGAAADLIALHPTDQAIQPLLEQLSRGNRSLRDASRAALIAIGPASIPAAEKLLADGDDQRKEDGSFILGGLRSGADLEAHIALLSSSNWQLALQAAKSLDEIRDSRAGPALAAVVARFSSIQNENGSEADSAFAAICASIISAAHLGYAPLAPTIQPLIDQRDCPPDVRDAAIYGLGLLGSASDSAACNKLLAIALDSEEAIPTRMEAIKALGHLRFQPADATFADMAETQGNLQMRWLAHWAHDRVTRKITEFKSPPLNWSADVAITDISEPTNKQQLTGTLGFNGSYLGGAWVPVHLKIRNGSPEDINGLASFPVASDGENAIVRISCRVPRESSVNLTAYGYFPHNLGSAAPIAATAEWTTADGARIARAPIAAAPLSTRDGFSAQSAHSLDTLVLCLIDPTDTAATRSGQAASHLASAISERIGFAVKSESLSIAEAPRQAVGYDSTRIVLLQADPERLDIEQRHALLHHIQMGGELLVCGTTISPTAWLYQYLPVIPLGRREVSAIQDIGNKVQYAMGTPSMIVEAANLAGADSKTLVADSDLIHVADRPLGLGFVVFTSFAPDALDIHDQSNSALWKDLLLLFDKSSRELPPSTAESLGQLVGTPTAPLSVPIAIIGLYVATLFISQRFFSGDSRPWAFAVTVGAGVIGFVTLVAISAVRAGRSELNGARITMVSLGPSGGGRQQDFLAFAGADNPSLRLTASDDAFIRPLRSSEPESVEIQELPFGIARARVHTTEVTQVWSASRSVDSRSVVETFGRFGPSGLTVSVFNGLGVPLRKPLLIWGAPWSLPEIETGTSNLLPLQRNPAGEFLVGGGIHTDSDVFRSKVIQESLGARRTMLIAGEDEPVLLGWADDLPALVQTSDATMTSLCMVRTPVVVMPSEPGTAVKIDGAFCRILAGPGAAPPYDQIRHQWVTSSQGGDWIIGFVPPAGIGLLRPEHVTLTADLSAPTQTITIFRGLCGSIGPKASAPGEELARWHQPINSESADFDCTTGDFDAAGRVWIKVHVESSLPSSSPWFFRKLELAYLAKVVGEPANSKGTINRE